MGYTTNFAGRFKLNRKLKKADFTFLRKLADTRRMARRLGPEYGVEGEFYVAGAGFAGQDHEANIIDYNRPPRTQPGLWCQWVPTEDGKFIEWDGNEKFYDYVEWIQYLINWLAPKGYVLSGEVTWQGEETGDLGKIIIKKNVVKVLKGKIAVSYA